MTIYQIITPVGCGMILIYGIMNFKHAKISIGELIMWFVVWGGIATSAIFPQKVISLLSRITGIANGVNAIVVPGLIILLFIIFKLYAKIDNIERKFIKLVRAIALKDANK